MLPDRYPTSPCPQSRFVRFNCGIIDALGLSMVHLQRYMDAATKVLDTAIASELASPKSETITVWYKDTREAERHVGTAWKQLEDGSMVRFSGGGYPSGMIRDTSVNQAGRCGIRVTGFAYQSDQPIVFSLGGTSFSSSHDWHNLPIILAGGGYRHGSYIAHDSTNNTPLANLFVALAQHMNLELNHFGTSTNNTIRGLETA